MLTESFVISLGVASDSSRIDPSKDASIAIFEHLPVVQQRSAYKKSFTPPHCLAISSTHIFAAQTEKAVVHVYNRSKGNQEATVPFTEKITCITLACNDTVLVLGTVEGRLFLWEVATGRQITTTQSHLQAVTCLSAADNYLVSTSADATARVWSLPTLLSFQTEVQDASPSKTYDAHRAPITAVALGHSASLRNVAITIAEDKTCMIWDYHTTTTIYTFLLSAIPACVDFDPADRAAYIGYQDGSVQQLNLLSIAKSKSRTDKAIQPGDDRRWSTPETSHGATLTLAVSFDGTSILTGHQSGAILAWDTANGHMRPLPIHPPITRPVTGLQILPIDGIKQSRQASYSIDTIVKPKFGAFQTSNATVPGNYAAQLHLTANTAKEKSAFAQALTAPVIPDLWLDRGLQELSTWSQPVLQSNGTDDDFMALTDKQDDSLRSENDQLRQQVAALQRVQSASFKRLEKLTAERNALLKREQHRLLNGGRAAEDDD